jgi:hypothetical protein
MKAAAPPNDFLLLEDEYWKGDDIVCVIKRNRIDDTALTADDESGEGIDACSFLLCSTEAASLLAHLANVCAADQVECFKVSLKTTSQALFFL